MSVFLALHIKKNTNSIKNSPSINLIKKIKNKTNKIFVHDSILSENIKNIHGVSIKNIKDLIKKSNIIFVMLDLNEYKKIDLNNIMIKDKKIIIDPFSVVKPTKNQSIEVYRII